MLCKSLQNGVSPETLAAKGFPGLRKGKGGALMPRSQRRDELSRLNVLFCLLVVFIHVASHAVASLDKLSWQFALVLIPQRLAFVSVPGFFLLSGVKLTLPRTRPQTLSAYWGGRAKSILLPYLLAAAVYYLCFVALGWFPFSLSDFAVSLVRGDLSAQFYFLIALCQFVLLAPLFRRLAARWSPVILLPFALGIMWLSSMYFNPIVQLAFPQAPYFPYSDRIFTSYLFYYLAGCCIGQHYPRFLALLKDNRGLITALAVFFAMADGAVSVLAFSGRRSAPYLELVHTLYITSAILLLFALATSRTAPLPRLAAEIDQASYLIYLYHCLVIVLFNGLTARLGLHRVSLLLVLRLLVVYPVTIGGCVLWQRLWTRLTARPNLR